MSMVASFKCLIDLLWIEGMVSGSVQSSRCFNTEGKERYVGLKGTVKKLACHGNDAAINVCTKLRQFIRYYIGLGLSNYIFNHSSFATRIA